MKKQKNKWFENNGQIKNNGHPLYANFMAKIHSSAFNEVKEFRTSECTWWHCMRLVMVFWWRHCENVKTFYSLWHNEQIALSVQFAMFRAVKEKATPIQKEALFFWTSNEHALTVLTGGLKFIKCRRNVSNLIVVRQQTYKWRGFLFWMNLFGFSVIILLHSKDNQFQFSPQIN